MGGQEGGEWAAGGRLYLPIGVFGVSMSPRSAIVIGPDKPGGPKKHLTNTGNIRPIPPIYVVPSMGPIVASHGQQYQL